MQGMFGLCEAKGGTEIDECLHVGARRHKRAGQDVKNESKHVLEDGRVPAKKARDSKIQRQRKDY